MTAKICIEGLNKIIRFISCNDFLLIEKYLLENKLASDKDDASIIKSRLSNPPLLNSSEFASEVIYVILASGFSQKTAKKKYFEIMDYINSLGSMKIDLNILLTIFNNKNKMSAIKKIWDNKEHLSENYYKLCSDTDKIKFLSQLPFIGPITKNHIARNLGVNTVKPDIWIVRLSDALGYDSYHDMFNYIHNETNFPVGYIDLILWKACQIGIIQICE